MKVSQVSIRDSVRLPSGMEGVFFSATNHQIEMVYDHKTSFLNVKDNKTQKSVAIPVSNLKWMVVDDSTDEITSVKTVGAIAARKIVTKSKPDTERAGT